MSINVKAYFGTSLLNRQDLGQLQQISLALAPSWSKGLRICDPYEGTPPIRVTNPDSLFESVSHDVSGTSPFLEQLIREGGLPKQSGICKVIELGGGDSSMTIIFSVDHRSFRKIGDIWIWGNHITVQIRRKTIAGVKADRFARQLLDKLCLQMQPWYAHAEDPAEFRAKNILADSTGTRAIGR